jgi:hypothetical protein
LEGDFLVNGGLRVVQVVCFHNKKGAAGGLRLRDAPLCEMARKPRSLALLGMTT